MRLLSFCALTCTAVGVFSTPALAQRFGHNPYFPNYIERHGSHYDSYPSHYDWHLGRHPDPLSHHYGGGFGNYGVGGAYGNNGAIGGYAVGGSSLGTGSAPVGLSPLPSPNISSQIVSPYVPYSSPSLFGPFGVLGLDPVTTASTPIAGATRTNASPLRRNTVKRLQPDGREIVIDNPTDQSVAYRLNQYSYTMKPGERQTFKNDRAWTIQFDRGLKTESVARYSLPSGRYQFEVDEEMGLRVTLGSDEARPKGAGAPASSSSARGF